MGLCQVHQSFGGFFHGCACSDERPLLNVRHDERTDRAVIAAVSNTHMAMMILTGLDLLTREQVACWNVKPTGNCLHQLIAGHGKAIHIAAAGYWIPRMRERRDGGKHCCYNNCYPHRGNTNLQVPA